MYAQKTERSRTFHLRANLEKNGSCTLQVLPVHRFAESCVEAKGPICIELLSHIFDEDTNFPAV